MDVGHGSDLTRGCPPAHSILGVVWAVANRLGLDSLDQSGMRLVKDGGAEG